MQAAPGSVSWVAAQPSVLGRYGGSGASSASLKGRVGGGAGGGGGCRAPGLGVARCCARAQEKRPPRVRKTKEERRELVESFINNYRVSNDGKFPSVNLTHKEVGGSYYIVREIVRDIIQENKVLGPGGLDATALSFEDCPDSSESSMKHELCQDNVEILGVSDDGQVSKDSVPEISCNEESFSLRNSAINTQILLGSSNILEAGVLNAVQNGSEGATVLETSLEIQNEVPSGVSHEIEPDSCGKQGPSFAHVSDAVYETNGALSREHDASLNDSLDATFDNAVNEANPLVKTNGVLQIKQTSLQDLEALPDSPSTADAQMKDNQLAATLSANGVIGSLGTEVTTKTGELSKQNKLQDESEQSLLDASHDEKEKSNCLVSHPALHTEELFQMGDMHSVAKVDESEIKKSTTGITTEEVDASDARHEEGMNTNVISRRTLKAQQKKYDNVFWLVLRAFVVAISKIWAK